MFRFPLPQHKDTFALQIRAEVPLNTSRIDQLLAQFRQQIAHEGVTDPVTHPDRLVRSTVADPADPDNEERIRKLEHQVSQLIQQVCV